MRAIAEALLKQLEASPTWPPPKEFHVLKDILKWQYMREADGVKLQESHPQGWDVDKGPYIVDPLASRIAEAFADLQFGEEPDWKAAQKSDQEKLEDMILHTGLPAEYQAGAEIQVSEGEVWWKAKVDKDMSDWPIPEMFSRSKVIPVFRGAFVVAAAFISVFEKGDKAYRYVECHGKDVVFNKLYQVPVKTSVENMYLNTWVPVWYQAGKPFGDPVSLETLPETAGLPPVWNHGCGLLCGRVINRRGKSNFVGVSQYARAQDLFYSLNEACSIGHHNMKLTMRQRVVIDESILKPVIDPDTGETLHSRPEFDSGESVFVQQGLDENLEGGQQPVKVIEYDFDAKGMVIWDDHLTNKILTRTRTAPSLIGVGNEGANTAPALRARLLDSNLAAGSKLGYWMRENPRITAALQRLDALDTSNGGFGRKWSDPTTGATMKTKNVVPEDPKDIGDRHATAVGAHLESVETALAEMHPEWTEEEINDEIDKIKQNIKDGLDGGSAQNGLINRDPNSVDPNTGDEPGKGAGTNPEISRTGTGRDS